MRGLRNMVLAGVFVLVVGALALATAKPRGDEAPSITETVLYSFCPQGDCTDGAVNIDGVIMDGVGNLYGTTIQGGANDKGTVFELTPSSTGWNEKVLYSFCSQSNCTDGYNPSGLILDGAGNLYGTTIYGGAYGYGTAFELTPSSTGWNEKVLYSFCSQSNCTDGKHPYAPLVMDGSGHLYGTTGSGGNANPICKLGNAGSCGVVFALDLAVNAYNLTVSKSGNGSGKVTSSPAGIDCGSTCRTNFAAGTQVTLTAAASSGSTFIGWGGVCSGSGSCVVTMNASQNVSAIFTQTIAYTLSVSVIGSLNGTVTSSPSGINCGSTCSASFSAGTQVTLIANPVSGSTYTWGGACSGNGSCVVTMNSDQFVFASFAPFPTAEVFVKLKNLLGYPDLLPY